MASTLKDKIKARTKPAKGQPYTVGARLIPAPDLPERAGALPESLQVLARNYIGARRRSGEALLDAARWLSEARAQAKHGEWQLFLEATSTSEGTANRLLDIHAEAMRSPQFAEALMRNWLSFTAAAELAQKSTPPEVKQALLNAPEPPSRAQVQAAKRANRIPIDGNLPRSVEESEQTKSTTVADLTLARRESESATMADIAPAHDKLACKEGSPKHMRRTTSCVIRLALVMVSNVTTYRCIFS